MPRNLTSPPLRMVGNGGSGGIAKKYTANRPDHNSNNRNQAGQPPLPPTSHSQSSNNSGGSVPGAPLAQVRTKPSIISSSNTTTTAAAAATTTATDRDGPNRSTSSLSTHNTNSNNSSGVEMKNKSRAKLNRLYYESLISHHLDLLRPTDALFFAELYHAAYDVSNRSNNECDKIIESICPNILSKANNDDHQDFTKGYVDDSEDEEGNGGSDDDGLITSSSIFGSEMRSTYWLALCKWHLGEISTVYRLLRPIVCEPLDAMASMNLHSKTGSEGLKAHYDSGHEIDDDDDYEDNNEKDSDMMSNLSEDSFDLNLLKRSTSSLSHQSKTRHEQHKDEREKLIDRISRIETTRIKISIWWLLSQACIRVERWQEAEDLLIQMIEPCQQFIASHIQNDEISRILRANDDENDDSGDGERLASLRYILLSYANTRQNMPDKATIVNLLGQICKRTNRHQKALEYFDQAIKLNPFSLGSMDGASHLGASMDILDKVRLTMSQADILNKASQRQATLLEQEAFLRNSNNENSDKGGDVQKFPQSSSEDDFRSIPPAQRVSKAPNSSYSVVGNNSRFQHQQFQLQQRNRSTSTSVNTPGTNTNTTKRRVASAGQASSNAAALSKAILSTSASSRLLPPTQPNSARQARSGSNSSNRSGITGSGGDMVAGEKKRTRRGVPISTSSSSTITATIAAQKTKDTITVTIEPGTTESTQLLPIDLKVIESMIATAKTVYETHHYQQSYLTLDVIRALTRLPSYQRNAPWALCMLGKSCYESGLYNEAEQVFSMAHQIEPHRLKDMDVYSTLLWHMRKESQLAQLAHTLIDVGRNWGPEAWLATANLFSLKGNHGYALKCLGRAIQLYSLSSSGIATIRDSDGTTLGSGAISGGGVANIAAGGGGGLSMGLQSNLALSSIGRSLDGCNIDSAPGLAYAHTLCGHEHSASNDYEKAQQSFRTAVRLDPRHYNAWYGLGMLYLRLGKLELAEYHFERALEINPYNPVLQCCIGMIHERKGEFEEALDVYRYILSSDVLKQADQYNKELQAGALGNTAISSSDASEPRNPMSVNIKLASQTECLVLFKISRVLLSVGRYKEAANKLEQLALRCPQEATVFFLLGQTYKQLRWYHKAVSNFIRAQDIDPRSGQAVKDALEALYDHDDDNDDDHVGDGGSGGALDASRYMDQGWKDDWEALDNADDRVERALDFAE